MFELRFKPTVFSAIAGPLFVSESRNLPVSASRTVTGDFVSEITCRFTVSTIVPAVTLKIVRVVLFPAEAPVTMIESPASKPSAT